MQDYKLRFETEQEANKVLNPILGSLHPSQYVRYDIGEIKKYEYDEDYPESEPVVIVVSDKYHVDLRLREAINSLDEYNVQVETPVHSFS